MKTTRIHALRQRKYELKTRAEQLLARAKSENRDLTPSELAEHERSLAALSANEADLIQVEAELESQRCMPTDPGAMVAAGNGTGQWRSVGNANRVFQPGPRPKKYAELFGPAPQSEFNGIGEFLRAVNFSQQTYDPRLHASQTETVPSEGGFMVPTEFSQQILDEALESEIVRPRAMVWPMTTDSRKVPAVQDNDHSNSSLYGGVTAMWANELESIDEMKVKLRMIGLGVNKLAMLSNASNELLEDTAFESVLGAKLVAGASWHLDNAFLFGNGAGKPLGALSAGNPALVTVAKETTQPANGIVYENVLKMFAAMAPRNRKNAVWVFNDALIPALYEMQNRVFNLAASEVVGGSAVPVFTVGADGSATLLTRPVLFSEKMQAPGTLGDAAFVDFGAYAIGVRREIILAKSIHAGFATDSSWYRLTTRVDGQPTWNKALTPLHGNPQSPYVILEAR
jgi:HK97 family phage major capsid protein